MSVSKAATLAQMVQVGLLARRYAELRMRLWRSELRRRGRLAAVGLGLMATAAMCLLLAAGLAMIGVAWHLQITGFSWPAALFLTAAGALSLGVLSALLARAAMRRAVDD